MSAPDAQPPSTPPAGVRSPWGVRGAAAAGVGTALVAGVASLCCAGPITVILLGAGGAVAAAGLAPYRLPLLMVSAVLLGVAFWQVYWRRNPATGAACSIAVGRATRIGLWVAAVAWWTALVLFVVV